MVDGNHPWKESTMSAPTLDRTWSEEAGGVHVEAHAVDFTADLIRGASVDLMVVRGDLDIATAPLLRSVLDMVCSGRARALDLDLSAVSFLDAYALATLITARRRLSARGAEIVLRDPSPIVRRVLELTGSVWAVTDTAGQTP
jgi:anti-sigma B factor antagonist